MYLHPGNWLSRGPALANRSKARAVGKDLPSAMTIDAGLSRREIGVRCNLNKAVAVAAIHSKLLDMQGVRERHRLVRLISYPGVLGREIVPNPERDGRTNHQHTDEKLERQPIGPSRKKIGHRVSVSPGRGITGGTKVEKRASKARFLDQKIMRSPPRQSLRASVDTRSFFLESRSVLQQIPNNSILASLRHLP